MLEFCNKNISSKFRNSYSRHRVRSRSGMDLDVDQRQALDIIKKGFNVFIGGEAGSGKSRLLKAVKNSNVSGIFFTASTGKAACAIEGTTIHSFAGN